MIPLLCWTLELVPQFYFHLWKKKISANSKKTFSHWFHTWKKHILSRKMMSSEDFFVLFFMWETKCGNKKNAPWLPWKNISSLIQTWKQKLIYKTFHLVSRFVFHVWNRIYKTTLLHVWKTKWKKSLCKRKPFFFFLRKPDFFFCFKHEKKTWNVFPLAFSVPFFFVWKRIKEMRNYSFLHAWNGKFLGRRHVFFFIFKQNKNILHMKKNPRGKKVWARNIFSFLK